MPRIVVESDPQPEQPRAHPGPVISAARPGVCLACKRPVQVGERITKRLVMVNRYRSREAWVHDDCERTRERVESETEIAYRAYLVAQEQRTRYVEESDECSELLQELDAFLDDPITVASGVGGELLHVVRAQHRARHGCGKER